MTDSHMPVGDVPILDEVGAGLHLAWRRHEARRRNRVRLVVAVAAVSVLAVPGAVAERNLTGLTPKKDAQAPDDLRRQVPGATLVAEGASPAGHWRMLSYRKGPRQCVGLSVPGAEASSNYAASCESPGGSMTSLGLLANATAVLVFGSIPDDARKVDVWLPDGSMQTAIPLRRELNGALLPGMQHGLRYFITVFPPRGRTIPARLQARDGQGRVVASLGGPRP